MLCGQQRSPPCAAVVEDPCETDENTARTLKLRHLETLRAEFNRAATLLGESSGEMWGKVKQSPVGKASKVVAALKPYLLPALLASPVGVAAATGSVCGGAVASSSDASAAQISSASVGTTATPTPTKASRTSGSGSAEKMAMQRPQDLPDEVADAVLTILHESKPGSVTRLPFHLNGDHRRSLHHWCEVCGVESHRIGKQKDGGFQVNIKKPADYLDATNRHSVGKSFLPCDRSLGRSPSLAPVFFVFFVFLFFVLVLQCDFACCFLSTQSDTCS
jgi:hypothetical protein